MRGCPPPGRLRSTAANWFPGWGTGANPTFVRCFRIVITEIAGRPPRATERCVATPSGTGPAHLCVEAAFPRAVAEFPRSAAQRMGCNASVGDVEFFSVVTVVLTLPPCKDFAGLTSALSVEWRDAGRPYNARRAHNQGAGCPASSGTTRQSTAVGRTWRNPNSAFYQDNVSIDASLTNRP
jgi:hypothetical protein